MSQDEIMEILKRPIVSRNDTLEKILSEFKLNAPPKKKYASNHGCSGCNIKGQGGVFQTSFLPSAADLRISQFSSLERESWLAAKIKAGMVQRQGSTIFIMRPHERGGNSRRQSLRVRPAGESFSWRKKWCASHHQQARLPAGVRHFPSKSLSLSSN